MGWRGLFRQPLARQCNSNCCISANTENIPPGFRLPGLSSPQHNFQLTSIFLEFCQLQQVLHVQAGYSYMTGALQHRRHLSPYAAKMPFLWHMGFMCRCVGGCSGMRAKAMSPTCFPGM